MSKYNFFDKISVTSTSFSDHMINSVRTSPHVTTFQELDLTELVEYRNEIKQSFKATYGANITYMSFIVKAVCTALKECPKMNASMTEKEINGQKFKDMFEHCVRQNTEDWSWDEGAIREYFSEVYGTNYFT